MIVLVGFVLIFCNIKLMILVDVEKIVSEGDGKVLVKKEVVKIEEKI